MLVQVISWPLVLIVIFLSVTQVSLACVSQDFILIHVLPGFYIDYI